jgi:hypothetical protein
VNSRRRVRLRCAACRFRFNALSRVEGVVDEDWVGRGAPKGVAVECALRVVGGVLAGVDRGREMLWEDAVDTLGGPEGIMMGV